MAEYYIGYDSSIRVSRFDFDGKRTMSKWGDRRRLSYCTPHSHGSID